MGNFLVPYIYIFNFHGTWQKLPWFVAFDGKGVYCNGVLFQDTVFAVMTSLGNHYDKSRNEVTLSDRRLQ
jgi:hypothetical protein